MSVVIYNMNENTKKWIVIISQEVIRIIPSSHNSSIHIINIVSFGILFVSICPKVIYDNISIIYENNGYHCLEIIDLSIHPEV